MGTRFCVIVNRSILHNTDSLPIVVFLLPAVSISRRVVVHYRLLLSLSSAQFVHLVLELLLLDLFVKYFLGFDVRRSHKYDIFWLLLYHSRFRVVLVI